MGDQARKVCPECGSLDHDGCVLASLSEPADAIVVEVSDRIDSGEISVEWVDNGVGPHDYWGARGVHTSWEPEIDKAYKVDVQWLYGADSAGEDIVVPSAHSFVLKLEDDEGMFEGEVGVDAVLDACSVRKTESGLLCCAAYWIEQG